MSLEFESGAKRAPDFIKPGPLLNSTLYTGQPDRAQFGLDFADQPWNNELMLDGDEEVATLDRPSVPQSDHEMPQADEEEAEAEKAYREKFVGKSDKQVVADILKDSDPRNLDDEIKAEQEAAFYDSSDSMTELRPGWNKRMANLEQMGKFPKRFTTKAKVK